MTQLVVALDEPNYDRARIIVEQTAPHVQWYKVGYEAYYGYGDQIITLLREAGKSIFLDLKLHDIPNTVGAAIRAAAKSGARLITLHATGGSAMLAAAANARDEHNAAGGQLRLLAVTVLTSLTADDLHALGVQGSPEEQVRRLALLAMAARIDGAVCSVAEAPTVRSACGPDFTLLCPGIRLAGGAAQDQRRVATPGAATLAGADFIVVGRPITKSQEPGAVARAILTDLGQNLSV
ncbi:MAG TPA: orotidine-5'-phosphate decarboxylase [Candidatus Eremiobacteraceae bacterium]|jgi:orotidine-5'-phosphate decarboxylase